MEYTSFGVFGLAFVGGLLLNLMPCVFPILSLKVLSIMRQGSESRWGAAMDGISYTAGVAFSMLFLSVALIMLRSAGHFLSWGFQMQSPAVVIALLHITFLLGLSFSGLLDVPFSVPFVSKTIGARNVGSFFAGVLSALVGTPCSAPFMVSAVSFALVQPGLRSIAIFQVMGLGMAFPYLILSCSPGLSRLLPKPGQWMEYLKQFLAFPMYATAAWLLHVLVSQKGVHVLLPTVLSVIVISLGVWFWGIVSSMRISLSKAVAVFLPLFVVGSSMYITRFYGHDHVYSKLEKVKFSEAQLAMLLEQGKTVFLAIGAEWCLTCKVNEKIIESASVRNFMHAHDIVYMKADFTSADSSIAEYLGARGDGGIPFYELYVKGRSVGPMPQIFSEKTLIEILGKNLNPE
ncbi:protein-disulfide reductase DsbD family protein [Anaplasma capra]|uniref:protein-disulfide reductase DsbD family protein n=1 Tax=Anaplasma capra TaxID=1562740 RepID=UPI0021D5C8F6|nr:thioredoxin family protein [Anaplasma capra]MCU7611277.1 thioredoxin family protein [Anaplasma capra]MCU7612706.1 thioredoxin family protein [Anaplasma capra]